MQRVFGDGDEIGQRLALAGLLLPTDDAPVFSIARSEQVRRAETPCCWEDSITVRISSLVCSLIHRPVIGTTNPLVFLQDRQFDRQVGQGAFLVLEFAFECLVDFGADVTLLATGLGVETVDVEPPGGSSRLRSPYGLPSPETAPLPCSVMKTHFEVTDPETAGFPPATQREPTVKNHSARSAAIIRRSRS